MLEQLSHIETDSFLIRTSLIQVLIFVQYFSSNILVVYIVGSRGVVQLGGPGLACVGQVPLRLSLVSILYMWFSNYHFGVAYLKLCMTSFRGEGFYYLVYTIYGLIAILIDMI